MIITIDDIRSYTPCYDPAEVVGEDWSGTLMNVLDTDEIKVRDKLWVITRFIE